MSAELARAIVSEVELHGRPFAAATPLRDLVRDRIAAEVHTASGWTPAAEPHRMVAIGPSGSGKTSSLVKLADAYTQAGLAVAVVSIEGPSSAGSLGTRLAEDIDGGADFDVRRVATVAAARAARKALAHHDLVLVDTPGACATDDAVLAHVQKLLKALGTAETHLVLPVSLAGREAGAAIARFDWADRLLVTKLDETRFPGALLSLAQHGELPLSYLGTGAGLQGGIQVANGRLIAERILPI
jgi:flagellar biosynthesis protein FlhF